MLQFQSLKPGLDPRNPYMDCIHIWIIDKTDEKRFEWRQGRRVLRQISCEVEHDIHWLHEASEGAYVCIATEYPGKWEDFDTSFDGLAWHILWPRAISRETFNHALINCDVLRDVHRPLTKHNQTKCNNNKHNPIKKLQHNKRNHKKTTTTKNTTISKHNNNKQVKQNATTTLESKTKHM